MSVLETQQRPVAEYGGPRVLNRPRRHPERWFAHLGLLLVSVGFVLPFAWMLSTSFKRLEDTAKFPPQWIPKPFMAENYAIVLNHPKMHFLMFTRNTLIIATLAVVGTTLSSSVVAYGFAKITFKGRGALFAVMLSTMMIPFPVIMVSMFVIFRWLGDVRFGEWQVFGQWLGTYKPLWVPAWFGSAFNIFLLRQFFMTIPDELSEAARIDGCSEFGIFWRIILPLARPALAVVALFTFLWAWNDFLGPLVYLQDQDQYTLSLGLQTFQSMHGGTEYHLLMAASVLVILPVIILFFMAQKTFIQGIATTGVKG
ncbi:MAG: carbohydrate ABC transporter permease [Planctomycetota bacterium]|nr:carbohydrate ABC transporter permease [Planctomycetota bacterium]